MKKRRADSTLFNLPDATQRAVYRMEEELRLTLAQIQQALEAPEGAEAIPAATDSEGEITRQAIEGFGVGHVSISSISNFLKEWRTLAWRESLHAAATMGETVKDTLSEDDRDGIDDAIMDGLREWILDSIVSRQIDAGSAKSLIGLIQKSKAQEMDERKLALLEKKAAAFDQIEETAEDDNLTPEERLERIRKGLKI